MEQTTLTFHFELDGARPACDLSSGWARLKHKLKKAGYDEMDEFDRFVLREAYRAAARRKKMTGYRWDVDHMIPVARGGRHRYDNFQVIPRWLNLWKGDALVLTRVGEYAAFLPGGGPSLFPSHQAGDATMSWNFEVKAVGGVDAERQFNNAVFDNSSHIPATMRVKLEAMAKTALYKVPEEKGRQATVILRSHGHVDPATGYGNFGVTCELAATPEEVPFDAMPVEHVADDQ
jgi:hypothetical protein